MQPSKFITLTNPDNTTPTRISVYNRIPGTVVVVGTREAMRIVEDNNNKAWVRYDGHTYTHEQFAKTTRDSNEVVRVVH